MFNAVNIIARISARPFVATWDVVCDMEGEVRCKMVTNLNTWLHRINLAYFAAGKSVTDCYNCVTIARSTKFKTVKRVVLNLGNILLRIWTNLLKPPVWKIVQFYRVNKNLLFYIFVNG
jgi:hypothetical protein